MLKKRCCHYVGSYNAAQSVTSELKSSPFWSTARKLSLKIKQIFQTRQSNHRNTNCPAINKVLSDHLHNHYTTVQVRSLSTQCASSTLFCQISSSLVKQSIFLDQPQVIYIPFSSLLSESHLPFPRGQVTNGIFILKSLLSTLSNAKRP